MNRLTCRSSLTGPTGKRRHEYSKAHDSLTGSHGRNIEEGQTLMPLSRRDIRVGRPSRVENGVRSPIVFPYTGMDGDEMVVIAHKKSDTPDSAMLL